MDVGVQDRAGLRLESKKAPRLGVRTFRFSSLEEISMIANYARATVSRAWA